ncbi:hypothetical protein V1460_33810 [Streptomyces sp. SCSIO 30461]|uniref:hypothetical protein n=1 Tax=Streptomyces sp. SCSIO 30461 TaxID=3118085 RepID=UPI0030CD0042
MPVMRVMRSSLVVASIVTAAVMPTGSAGAAPADAVGGAGTAGAVPASFAAAVPEADTAHHGHAVLWEGLLDVWLTSENHGPDAVPGTTVWLTFSAPPGPDASLPDGCLWVGYRTVLCHTGELRAASTGPGRALRLRLAGEPAEVVIAVTTVWNGGAVDRNHANDRHIVLVPATGDRYTF